MYVQSVHIISKVVSSNPVRGEVYSIQHYVVKFVSDLRQVVGFLWVHRATILTEILFKVALNTINHQPPLSSPYIQILFFNFLIHESVALLVHYRLCKLGIMIFIMGLTNTLIA